MTNETIQAIAGLWKLAAVVLLALTLYYFRTPIHDWLSRRKNLRFRRGDTEVFVEDHDVAEKSPSNETAEARPEPEAQPEHPEKLGKELVSEEEDNVLLLMLNHLESGNKKDAVRAYEELKTKDAEFEDDIMFQGLVYRYLRDPEALEFLQTMAKDEKAAGSAFYWLGQCHEADGNLEKAESSYRQAISRGSFEENRARYAVALAKVLHERGHPDKGRDVLLAELKKAETETVKARLFGGLAHIEDTSGNALFKALYLAKVSEYRPTDASARFQAAYAFSQAGLPDLAILYYETLHTHEADYSMARNNMSIAHDKLGLKSLATQNLFESAEKDNTLAMANLAYRYLDAGFFEDAEGWVQKALVKEKPHANVPQAAADMASRRQNEETEKLQMIERARRRKSFLKTATEAHLQDVDLRLALGAEWRVRDFGSVELEPSGSAVTFTFHKHKIVLDIVDQGCFGKAKIYTKSYGILHEALGQKYGDPIRAVAVIDRQGKHIEVVSIDIEHDLRFVIEQRSGDHHNRTGGQDQPS